MRLPNGYGSVYKLSGKRRKPYVARITANCKYDKDTKTGKLEYRILGYFETRKDALQKLADYHTNPYSIENETVTFSEIYEKWSETKFDKISRSNVNGYKASYAVCESLYNMRMVDIKATHLQNVMDTCGKGYGTRRKLKVLLNQIYNYSVQNDVIDKNYANFVKIGEKDDKKKIHKPFSKKEIAILWENINRMEFIDTILIMIYTGLRPGELGLIKNQDIHLEERYFKGGLKTLAGKNRVIPINKKIEPFLKSRMSNNEYLITNHESKQMSYYNYRTEKFGRIMEQLEMNHLPHDCRHTFASLMDSAGANKICIKRIMGHASNDITDKVYTHKEMDELIESIDLI